jgi:hypothetical protein
MLWPSIFNFYFFWRGKILQISKKTLKKGVFSLFKNQQRGEAIAKKCLHLSG